VAARKAPGVVEPWQEAADWSSNGPYGAATLLKRPLPCAACRKPAYLLSPRKQVPMHKECAERAVTVLYLGRILVALGQPVTHDALQ
jgi:hypothetical protein